MNAYEKEFISKLKERGIELRQVGPSGLMDKTYWFTFPDGSTYYIFEEFRSNMRIDKRFRGSKGT
ncbi:hypothetical protein LCGC14_1736120 [marine sediment metagenome]|uniref:Aminoglycoside phosphotransferase domain-containing protein n=1 Tax=marine sediment metagenome TaxID=412755 RepID=A0A0F9JNG3_9ZZZZ